MISEASFSKRFTSFWNELLPNAKNYVRIANSAARVSTHRPLPPSERRQNTAFVNTLAFILYRLVTVSRQDAQVLFSPGFRTSPELVAAAAESNRYLQRFRDYAPHELPLSEPEWQQTLQIAQILANRYNWIWGPLVAPPFDGCGFLNPAEGDLFFQNKLVEIKSGERAFSLVDFRQVLVYCTLNHFSKNRLDIKQIELFNPRMGILFSESIDDFAVGMSSLGALELFEELGSYVSNTTFTELADEASTYLHRLPSEA